MDEPVRIDGAVGDCSFRLLRRGGCGGRAGVRKEDSGVDVGRLCAGGVLGDQCWVAPVIGVAGARYVLLSVVPGVMEPAGVPLPGHPVPPDSGLLQLGRRDGPARPGHAVRRVPVRRVQLVGQGSTEDARLPALLTAAHGTSLEIAPYYEGEGNATAGVTGSPNPTSTQITSDLNYLASHYIADPNYLWIGGKPALFVYGDATDNCSTADRWAAANAAAATHFYLVLKVFSGYP